MSKSFVIFIAMALPFFYTDQFDGTQNELMLDEDSSRHIVQVLRMKNGELLNLTDGKGHLLTAGIKDDNKKHCLVSINHTSFTEPSAKKIAVAVSLLKNTNRFEWFLEKATELGVNEIIPLLCERTEKEKFRHDRLRQICVSAMLQSQQTWLPVLREPVSFEKINEWKEDNGVNLIAHCLENEERKSLTVYQAASSHLLIAIGPEGDFSPQEIQLALDDNFIPVTLGKTRLRTETAGVVAAALLCTGRE